MIMNNSSLLLLDDFTSRVTRVRNSFFFVNEKRECFSFYIYCNVQHVALAPPWYAETAILPPLEYLNTNNIY